MRFFLSFVASMYLLGVIGFGANYYFVRPEQSLRDAIVYGIAWPRVMVEMARSPSL